MKVTILSGNLQKKLVFVNHAISSKVHLPILSHMLLEAKNEALTISATDLEIGIETTVSCQVGEEGTTTVPAKLFLELISSFPEEKITLTTTDSTIVVEGKNITSSLQTMPKDEFPVLFEEKGEEVFTLPIDTFKKDLATVVFATSTETTRPALSGVLIKKHAEGFTFVATDGYRMSVKQSKMGLTEEGESMIIPSRVIREALQLKESESISLFSSKQNNQVIFSQDTTLLIGRLIEGEFPKYQKIIPTDTATKVTFDRDELLKAVKTSMIFARETGNVITFHIKKEGITVTAKTPLLGENKVEVEAKLEGEENQIAFNARFLFDALANLEDQELLFEMTGPLNPGVFKIASDPTYLHLIMPIRV